MIIGNISHKIVYKSTEIIKIFDTRKIINCLLLKVMIRHLINQNRLRALIAQNLDHKMMNKTKDKKYTSEDYIKNKYVISNNNNK